MKNSRILIIDDDADLVRALTDFLKRQDFRVTWAASAEEGMAKMLTSAPDVVVLDINLPEMSGFEFCKEFKANTALESVPILILSSRASELDKVMGLELGAEDYLTKPFGTREFLARLKTILRRTRGKTIMSGKIYIDLTSRTVSVAGKPIRLAPKEFELLAHLINNKNRLLDREHLLRRVWPDTDSLPNTLDVHMKRLRTKLGDEGNRIETHKGIGYKLTE